MDEQTLNSQAIWSDKRNAWLVQVEDGEQAYYYEVVAPEEWVIPFATMAYNYIDITQIIDCLPKYNWKIKEIQVDDNLEIIDEFCHLQKLYTEEEINLYRKGNK